MILNKVSVFAAAAGALCLEERGGPDAACPAATGARLTLQRTGSAVRSSQAKARLQSVAYGQQKVVDASVVFIICGTLAAHDHLAQVLMPSVDAGIMEQQMVDGWVALASAAHADNPTLQRDDRVSGHWKLAAEAAPAAI